MFKWIFGHNWFTSIISVIADLASVTALIWTGFQFFGYTKYQFVLQKNANVLPKISIYQGSTIRLGADFRDNLVANGFKKTDWSLSSRNVDIPLSLDGLDQDITISPNLNGLVKLKLEIETFENEKYYGEYSFQILPTTPKIVKTSDAGIEIQANSGFDFKKGDEVYIVEANKKIPATVDTVNGSNFIKPVNKDADVSAYAGKIYLSPKATATNVNTNKPMTYPKPASIQLPKNGQF